MKKQGIAWLLVACLLLGLTGCASQPSAQEMVESTATQETTTTPSNTTVATAADGTITYKEDSVEAEAGVEISGTTATITAAGTYTISGSCSNGQLVVDAPADSTVTLILDNLTLTSTDGPAINGQTGDLVIVLKGENTLTDTATYTQQDVDGEPDACLYSKDDLTISGEGSLAVTGNYKLGIETKDDLVIEGGTITVTAVDDAMRGHDSVTVVDGTVTLNAAQDGLKSNNADEGKGWITIEGGTLVIRAGDDGIHAEATLTINDGVVQVEQSNEGLEGTNVIFNGGDVSVVAADDAVNASTDTTATPLLEINGGTIYVNSGGDGLDSNGNIAVNGGTVIVDGPTDSGNGPVDIGDGMGYSFNINGGTFIASGSTGMALNASSTSTQVSFLYAFSGAVSAGTEVQVLDAQGNVVTSFTPQKTTYGILVSDAALTVGETYTIQAGSQSGTITLTATTNTNGAGFGMMGGMGGMMGGFGQGQVPSDQSGQNGMGHKNGQGGMGPQGGQGFPGGSMP